jgi:predicted GIY-YIG superfamily endonuclease
LRIESFPVKYYVYLLKDGDKIFYVGKGTGKRMYQHAAQARAGKRRSPCLCKIRKMEREGRRVIYERVLLTEDAEEAFRKEVELIAQFGIDNLTNLTHGGEGARRITTSPEHREKIRQKLKQLFAEGRLSHPQRPPGALRRGTPEAAAWEAHKRHLSEVLKGRPRGPDSSETRRKKSAAQKALWASGKRMHSPEALERIREGGRRGGLARSRTKA